MSLSLTNRDDINENSFVIIAADSSDVDVLGSVQGSIGTRWKTFSGYFKRPKLFPTYNMTQIKTLLNRKADHFQAAIKDVSTPIGLSKMNTYLV